jgi:histone-lysine N-methyltransferase SETD1
MSRAPGASFAQFFPAAPRAAKDKAKEREKFKIQSVESPNILPVADAKTTLSITRIDDAALSRPGRESGFPVANTTAPQTEDIELQGDILNGVGSASSHTSSLSSVFSAPNLQNTATFGGAANVSSLTPLTNIDSSPSHITSPTQYKTTAFGTSPAVPSSERHNSQDILPQVHHNMEVEASSESRFYARDPTRGVKGTICTYDPLLDRTSSDKKKSKPTYKEFGLVRITYSVGSVILHV